MIRIYYNLLFLLVALSFMGCAVTSVPLKNIENTKAYVPVATASTVVVVTFDDERGIQGVGFTNDGKEIKVQGSIPQWATKNFGTMLQQQGYRVATASSLKEAEQSRPDIIVTGSIKKVYLEADPVSSKATITITITTIKKDGTKRMSTLSSTTSQVNNPFEQTESDVLLKSLLQAYSGFTFS